MEKTLESIGFTKGEIKVYISLLSLGLTSTGNIILKSQITSSKVYYILEKLEKKGLVSHVIKNNVKYFKAQNPNKILEFVDIKIKEIETKKNEINTFLPELEKKFLSKSSENEATLFQGRSGFKSARDEFISNLKEDDEYLVLGSKEEITPIYVRLLRQIQFDNEEKKIKTRIIHNDSFKKFSKKTYGGFKLTSVKYTQQEIPNSIAIGKDRILLMSYGESPIQVLIKNKNMCVSYKNFFENLWQEKNKR